MRHTCRSHPRIVRASAGCAAVLVAGSMLGFAPPAFPPPFFVQHNLVADAASLGADHIDPNLVNAWGLSVSPTGPWWVSAGGTGLSTLYNGAGVPQSLVVTIPSAAGNTEHAKPTGTVYNGTSGFVVRSGSQSAPSRFLFATEDGLIAGWAPAVPLPPPSLAAQVAVDNSAAGAIYKGLAIDQTEGHLRLFATDFHNARIDVFDGSFTMLAHPARWEDRFIPAGYAPFGIQNAGGRVYVTYAKQDADAEDDVAGSGLGFVDVFDTNGRLLRRLIQRGKLNAPWGLAIAPAHGFGRFSGDLLVGNFGDGRINAYEPTTGGFDGTLTDPSGQPIEIDGLWGLAFGNGGAAGPRGTLFFSAGPDDESHGLFGKLDIAFFRQP